MKETLRYENNTDKPITLREEHGIGKLVIPPNGGVGKVLTGAQNKSQRDYASRVTLNWNFIKCMENEQKLLEILKDDLKTYYALSIMKHFLLKDHNILVKTINVGKPNEKIVKFTAIDLQEALGCKTRQTASNRIKKLKQLNIVKSTIDEKYGKVFAMNPDYFMNGTYVPKEIYDLFDITKKESK